MTKLGSLSNIRLKNIHGVAENSFRVDAHPDMAINNVLLEETASRNEFIVGPSIPVESSITRP